MVQPPSEDDMEQPGVPSANGRSTVRRREGFDKTLKTNDEAATESAAHQEKTRLPDKQPMPESTKAALAVEDLLRQKSLLPATFDFRCAGPGCGNVLRKPRYLTFGTRIRCRTRGGVHVDDVVPDRRATWCWCSQECLEAWGKQFHLPGPSAAKYDQEGNLIGYVVSGRGTVTLDEIDAARGGDGRDPEA